MRVLVACERSGRVRDAFAQLGHDVWSCDVVESEMPGNHLICDVRSVLSEGWDLMIAHPPCTYLSYAGARWFSVQPDRMAKAEEAFEFFMMLINAPIPMIAVENPRGLAARWYRPSDQKIQPWQFGDPATKETHLWLKNLPVLLYTCKHINPRVNWTESKRGFERSKTFPGIARAMASQWGCSGGSFPRSGLVL